MKGFYAVFNRVWNERDYLIYLWDGKCVWCVDPCEQSDYKTFKWRRTSWKSIETLEAYCKNGEFYYLGE